MFPHDSLLFLTCFRDISALNPPPSVQFFPEDEFVKFLQSYQGGAEDLYYCGYCGTLPNGCLGKFPEYQMNFERGGVIGTIGNYNMS